MITFDEARQIVTGAWPDYEVAGYGYETDGHWLLILLPSTAGGRVPAVDKSTGAITWINENAEMFDTSRPVGAALTAHLPGQHNQASHGGGGDRPESFDEFGPVMEEWEATGGGVIAVHDPDGASYGVVSMSFPDDDDALSPWGAFTPDEARELADMIEGADAEMRVYRGEPTGPGGLVLGNTVVLPGGSGVIVGNTKEEVAIGWPRSPAARLEDVGGYDMRYISDDEVEDLTDFLRQASDLADDLIDEAEEG